MFSKFKFFLIAVAFGATSIANAEDAAWRVSKTSGEVWVTTSGAQPISLPGDATLKPGDLIRTGQTGRVLLVRGAESILVSANSVVGIPMPQQQPKTGLPSTILQQAGTILLDVEKRNVQHFEVQTPYLAAVVKGTQFRVSVTNTGSNVEVIKGQVQVSDHKTGQFTLVNAEQVARVSTQGPAGLSLTGTGPMSPIFLGPPRSPAISPVVIPEQSVSAPAPQQVAQNTPTTSERRVQWTPTVDTSKDSGLMAWLKDTFGLGKKSSNEDVALVLAVPVVIFLGVAVGAAAMRRRKINNKPTDSR